MKQSVKKEVKALQLRRVTISRFEKQEFVTMRNIKGGEEDAALSLAKACPITNTKP